MIYQTLNPALGLLEKIYEFSSDKTVESVLSTLGSEFKKWREIAPEERARRVGDLAADLLAKQEELAAMMAREMGKPVGQGRSEIEKSAWLIKYYSEQGAGFLAEESIASEHSKSYVKFEPLGVILCIMPWNFPFWQALRFCIPVLVAGNAVLLKHAPSVPECTVTLIDLFIKHGLPARHLFIDEKQVAAIMTDRRIAGVSFTGSVRTGKILAARAGLHMKKSVFELGGSDPYLVLEDADVSSAARICAESRLINSGQSCVAAKRFIVHRSLRRDFEDAFCEAINVPFGDPMENPALGPLARDDLRMRLQDMIQESKSKGARVLLGGTLPDTRGFFYPASVLTDITTEMPVWEDETFGPVAALAYFDGEEEAIELANNSEFGLGAAVFSKDAVRAESIARKLEAGFCAVNDMVRSDPRFPFGGIKDSGIGRELGSYGIKEFVNVKTIKVR
ncbi:MAG: NAD-dependent succinate-semialdehyde dehydrogenase [Spirochaetia bacterium]|nr:NAD-dependent succinate-semialdehyde dehydrogenase [Spirochaetia bacterium]